MDILYDTICLSGGGIKGFSFLGVLEYFETNCNLDMNNITHWIGTSIGAITSFLLSIGYSVNEIKTFILDFNFLKLEPIVSIDLLLNECGIDNGEKMMVIFVFFLKHKLNVTDITFIELYKLTCKKLSIIGTNYSTSKEEIFNYILTPNMSVLTAVRISISIPLIFTPVLYNSSYYIDGCFINGFPITHCNKVTTLGIYIKNCDINNNKLELVEYLKNCLSILSNTIFEKDIALEANNIIVITNNKPMLVNFNMTYQEKVDILNLGYEYAAIFVEKQTINICNKVLTQIIDNIVENNDIQYNKNIENDIQYSKNIEFDENTNNIVITLNCV